MNKLNNVEAQRVMAVLSETTDKLNFVELLPEQHSEEFLQELERNGFTQLAEMARTQYQLEESLFVMQGGQLKAPNRNSHTCFETRKRVYSSLRAICRVLMNDPSMYSRVMSLLADVQEYEGDTETKEGMIDDKANSAETKVSFPGLEGKESKEEEDLSLKKCREAVVSLKDVTLRSLGTTVEEETSIFGLMQAKVTRAKEIGEDLTTLQLQLNIEHIEKEAALSELDTTLSKLQKELNTITESIRVENEAIAKETKEKATSAEQAHSATMERLSKELEECKSKYKTMIEEAEEVEVNLRKKKLKFENEVAQAREQYDTALMSKLQEQDNLERQYDIEKKKLLKFEEHFKKRDEELAVMAEEEAKWEEFLKEEWEKERPIHEGAVAIQKLFRGAAGRREVNSLQKKKGKKK